MASTKIQNLPLKAPIGAMKIPTGGFGDYSITVSSIGDFIIDTFNLATKDYVDNLLVEKEDRIDTTGGFLTPVSQNSNVPDTTNDVIDEVAQALLDRIEYVKDNFSAAPSHNELTGRSATGAHPSTSISHKSGTVYTYLSNAESDINTINNVTIPTINQSLSLKQDQITTTGTLTGTPEETGVNSVSHTGINGALQGLLNRSLFNKNHSNLTNRSDANSHPASAISYDSGSVSSFLDNQKNLNNKLVQVINSVADLIAYTPRFNGEVVYVKSYHSGLGKGGGTYIYDSTKASVNNGVTVLNGWVLQLTDNIITSEMAGLTGDTSIDGEATTKLKALASSVSGYIGYNICLVGNFNTTEPIIFTNLTDCTIQQGNFNYVTALDKVWNANNCRGAINLKDCTRTHITKVKVKGARMPYPLVYQEDGQGGIALSNSIDCSVSLCNISDTHTWSISAFDCSGTKVFDNKCKGVARQSGISIWIGNGSGNIAWNNDVEECGLYGIEIEASVVGGQQDGVAYNNRIRNCMHGVTVVGLQKNVKVYENEIEHCIYGASLSIDPSITQQANFIHDNTILSSLYGTLITRSLSADLFDNTIDGKKTSDIYYIPSPYSSIVGTDSPTIIYLVNSNSKTNGYAWSVGKTVRINGTLTKVLSIENLASYSNYAGSDTFLKLTLETAVSDIKIGDFVYANAGDIAGTTYGAIFSDGTISNFTNNKIRNVSFGASIRLSVNTGSLGFDSNSIQAINGALRFTSALTTSATNVNISNLKLLGGTNIVLNSETISVDSIKNLFTNKRLQTNKVIEIAYPRPVVYGQFASSPLFNLVRNYYSNEQLCLVGLSVDYVNLKSTTTGPDLIINEQNVNLTLAKVKATETTGEEVGASVKPYVLNNNFTYRLTTSGAANDVGYDSLVYRLHCI